MSVCDLLCTYMLHDESWPPQEETTLWPEPSASERNLDQISANLPQKVQRYGPKSGGTVSNIIGQVTNITLSPENHSVIHFES